MAEWRNRALRRVFHTYWRFQRGLTLGVRGLARDGEGRVFLILHSYTPGWQLPGGGVEVGETALDALARELAEEANLTPTAPPRLHGLFHNGHVSARDHVAIYVIDAFAQPGLPAPNREIAACGWFAPDDLPAGTTPGTRRRIAEIRDGRPPTAAW